VLPRKVMHKKLTSKLKRSEKNSKSRKLPNRRNQVAEAAFCSLAASVHHLPIYVALCMLHTCTLALLPCKAEAACLLVSLVSLLSSFSALSVILSGVLCCDFSCRLYYLYFERCEHIDRVHIPYSPNPWASAGLVVLA